MGTAKIILFTSKKLKDGSHPLMVCATADRKRKYAGTKLKLKSEYWDAVNQRLVVSPPSGNKYKPGDYDPKNKTIPQFDEELAKIKKRIDAALKDLEDDDWSAEDFITSYVARKSDPMTVLEFFDERIKTLKEAKRIGNAVVYRNARKSLEDFIPQYYPRSKDISFRKLTPEFMVKFKEYYEIKGNQPGSISIYMRTIRAVVNRAIFEKKASRKDYPFSDSEVEIPTGIPSRHALSKEEFISFKSVALEDKQLIESRDYFLWSFYCRGMNFADMAELKVRNITREGDHYILTYYRKKTMRKKHPKPIVMEIMPQIEYLVIKFWENRLPDEYLFPILKPDMEPAQMYEKARKTRSRVNHDIRSIAMLAGINKDLTFYSIRHTYATLLVRENVSVFNISKMMDHKDTKTTEDYLDSLTDREQNQIMKQTITY